MNAKISIAIDGYSACGKSTLTKALARALGYRHIDSGAMYRAVTLYFILHNVNLHQEKEVKKALQEITIDFEIDKSEENVTMLNGKNVEHEIRSMSVSKQVSHVAAIPVVREFLVARQRRMAKEKGVVMDGRDIGTVVLPNAELKLFMIADKAIRVQRRLNELNKRGVDISDEEVKTNIEQRDFIDTHRAESPLQKADDAVLLDNTHLNPDEQLAFTIACVNKRLKTKEKPS